MACIDEELIQRFLAGDLSVSRLSQVESHIDGCKTCFELVVAAAGPSSPAHSTPPGAVIAGRYRILSLLGVGASGQVFEAFDQLAQAPVALKVLRPDLAADPRWVARLTRELQIARRIDHRHVCRVLNLEEADGQRFLVMELARGSLRTEMTRPATLSPAQALQDARAIAAGLEAIHRGGIVHRDVKPENVLRMPDGRLVLSDFGLAAIPTQQATLTLYVGTPSYMAPELAQGEAASVASDIWSLGVVLHELLLGGRPRWKSQDGRRALSEPAAAGLLTGQQEIERLCAACLSAVPEERPASAAEIGARLEAVSSGRPARRSAARFWRRPSRLAGVAAAGVLLGAGGWWGAQRLARPPRPPTKATTATVRAVPPPIRPLVLFRSSFTEATPPWAGAVAVRLVTESLAQIPGIELRPWTEQDRGARKAGLRPWLVAITSGQDPERPDPEPADRRSGIPVEVTTHPPDETRGSLSNERCPADRFARCLREKTVTFIKGSLQAQIQRDVTVERARRESSGRARSALELYFKIPAPERTSGKSVEALQYIESALQSQPDSFPALLERARFAIYDPRGSIARTDGQLPTLEGLRKKRPGEPGLAASYCRASTIRLLEGSPTEGELAAVEDLCKQAQQSEIDGHPVLFSLAQLRAKRCDAKGALGLLQTIFDERGQFFGDVVGSASMRTPASRAGRDLTALLLISSLAPLENESQWLLTTAIINGAGTRVGDPRAPAGYAEAEFRRALTESRAHSLWSGGGFDPRDAHRAAAIRGLMMTLRSRAAPVTPDLTQDLENAELGWDWGEAAPFELLPYYWVDPGFARRLLRKVETPAGCTPAIQKAMLLQALGDRAGRDAALAACKEDQAWIASCKKLLSGPIRPAPLESVGLSGFH
jgi:serine/threonine protein kinase